MVALALAGSYGERSTGASRFTAEGEVALSAAASDILPLLPEGILAEFPLATGSNEDISNLKVFLTVASKQARAVRMLLEQYPLV